MSMRDGGAHYTSPADGEKEIFSTSRSHQEYSLASYLGS